MARPPKCRRICREPYFDSFVPEKDQSGEVVFLTVDEYEVIRLLDFEKLTQEQCAEMMEIARTTVTEMYERARFKTADCLVNGKRLFIGGGRYVTCDGTRRGKCCKGCNDCKNGSPEPSAFREKGENTMRIAVTYENGNIFGHFGHTEQFKLYDVNDGKIVGEQVIDTNGQGHGALATFLKVAGADALICGGIGGGAVQALEANGVKLYAGNSGDADKAVKALIDGTLVLNSEANCSHHHEGEHDCGSHSCGGNCHN